MGRNLFQSNFFGEILPDVIHRAADDINMLDIVKAENIIHKLVHNARKPDAQIVDGGNCADLPQITVIEPKNHIGIRAPIHCRAGQQNYEFIDTGLDHGKLPAGGKKDIP